MPHRSANERSQKIIDLRESKDARFAYVWATVSAVVSSQIRALRLRSPGLSQKDLARRAGLRQSQVSRFETPGVNLTLETLANIAAASEVALKVEFVSFSEMLRWENNYSQDHFSVRRLSEDWAFCFPGRSPVEQHLPILPAAMGVGIVEGQETEPCRENPYNSNHWIPQPKISPQAQTPQLA